MDIVAGCVIKKDNKILMVQEANEKYYGQWNFPAGHVDEGENIMEGAIREVKEETGCDVKLTGLLPIKTVYQTDIPTLIVEFTACGPSKTCPSVTVISAALAENGAASIKLNTTAFVSFLPFNFIMVIPFKIFRQLFYINRYIGRY